MNGLDLFLVGFITGSIVVASLWALMDYEPPKLEKKK